MSPIKKTKATKKDLPKVDEHENDDEGDYDDNECEGDSEGDDGEEHSEPDEEVTRFSKQKEDYEEELPLVKGKGERAPIHLMGKRIQTRVSEMSDLAFVEQAYAHSLSLCAPRRGLRCILSHSRFRVIRTVPFDMDKLSSDLENVHVETKKPPQQPRSMSPLALGPWLEMATRDGHRLTWATLNKLKPGETVDVAISLEEGGGAVTLDDKAQQSGGRPGTVPAAICFANRRGTYTRLTETEGCLEWSGDGKIHRREYIHRGEGGGCGEDAAIADLGTGLDALDDEEHVSMLWSVLEKMPSILVLQEEAEPVADDSTHTAVDKKPPQEADKEKPTKTTQSKEEESLGET